MGTLDGIPDHGTCLVESPGPDEIFDEAQFCHVANQGVGVGETTIEEAPHGLDPRQGCTLDRFDDVGGGFRSDVGVGQVPLEPPGRVEKVPQMTSCHFVPNGQRFPVSFRHLPRVRSPRWMYTQRPTISPATFSRFDTNSTLAEMSPSRRLKWGPLLA